MQLDVVTFVLCVLATAGIATVLGVEIADGRKRAKRELPNQAMPESAAMTARRDADRRECRAAARPRRHIPDVVKGSL